MSDGGVCLKFKWLDKLKKIKHIEIYVLVLFVAIVGIIFFQNRSKTTVNSNNTSTVTGYIDDMESKLENILSKIDGVSNVSVMITLDVSKTQIENSSIKMDSFPQIKGVLITAKGVDDTYTKMKVLHAIETVIDVKTNNVQILQSK